MPLYFLALDGALFEQRLRPALAAAWRQRSFAPCRQLCADLLPRARDFAERYLIAEEPLLQRVSEGLSFDRDFWRFLAGELFWYCAEEIPELQTTPAALCRLLAPDRDHAGGGVRAGFAPIEQVFFGSRDLNFGGGRYRPDHAGHNDAADVRRLSDYLHGLEPDRWSAADLASLPDAPTEEDRADELAFVREWLPPLLDLYRRCARHGRVLVCELLAPPSFTERDDFMGIEVKPTHARFGVLGFLCSLSLITYLDRVCISRVRGNIMTDLTLSKEDMGLVFGAFAIGYGLFEVPGGWMGDVWGARRVLARIVIWWSVFTALTGCIWPFALDLGPLALNGLVALVVVRFLFGCGEAGAYPNVARVVGSWFPYHERTVTQGAVG